MDKNLISFMLQLMLTSATGMLVFRLVKGELDPGFAYSFTLICALLSAQRLIAKLRRSEVDMH